MLEDEEMVAEEEEIVEEQEEEEHYMGEELAPVSTTGSALISRGQVVRRPGSAAHRPCSTSSKGKARTPQREDAPPQTMSFAARGRLNQRHHPASPSSLSGRLLSPATSLSTPRGAGHEDGAAGSAQDTSGAPTRPPAATLSTEQRIQHAVQLINLKNAGVRKKTAALGAARGSDALTAAGLEASACALEREVAEARALEKEAREGLAEFAIADTASIAAKEQYKCQHRKLTDNLDFIGTEAYRGSCGT